MEERKKRWVRERRGKRREGGVAGTLLKRR